MNAQEEWKKYYRKAQLAKREGAKSWSWELLATAQGYRREAALERRVSALEREKAEQALQIEVDRRVLDSIRSWCELGTPPKDLPALFVPWVNSALMDRGVDF